ncbi:MAG: single-strand DNA-binding protein [Frankiaceae bacterium]|jgi:single-strand DNA-binding protein|nr:single-strand DNA-binding protein [Frankiaceae bacterium]
MNVNQCTLAGNVVKEPSFSLVGADNTPRARFRLASTKRRRTASGDWEDAATVFISVTCWRSLAEHVSDSLRRGDTVVVSGELVFDEWDDKEGNRRSDYGIDAKSVGLDLSRFNAMTLRAERRKADASTDAPPAPADGDPFDALAISADAASRIAAMADELDDERTDEEELAAVG